MPKFELDPFVDCLKKDPRFSESGWNKVVSKYSDWIREVGNLTSTLNQKLYLYGLICAEFDVKNGAADSCLVGVTLAESPKVGDSLKVRAPDGTVGFAKIMRREITDRLGVLFTLESAEGFVFSQEVFD